MFRSADISQATCRDMADPQISFSDQFQVKEDLGKGAFSIVKKVTHVKTSHDYAAKIINTRRLTSRDLQKLEREARICRMLKHHNIVRLHHVFQEEHVRYMIFDLITGGELFDDIVAREFYSEKDASHCIQQILESVSHCHSLGIIHRDIKPENLLLASKEPGASVKLADFGLAVEAMDGKHYYGFAGTPGYLSPEVLRKDPYTYAVDIWACGVVLYILLVGYPPFWDDDQHRMFEQIKKGRYEYPSPEWDTVTTSAKELIDRMLCADQNRRISAHDALKHPWILSRDRVASTVHRQETISGLKRFNARRKLKAAVHTAMIVSRRSTNFLSTPSKASTIKEKPSPMTPVMQEDDASGQTAEEKEIMELTQRLINAVIERDFHEYSKLCMEEMTCFEPEACCQLISGMDFHKFYFEKLPATPGVSIQQSMVTPKVHMLGENAACIAYIRLVQTISQDGKIQSISLPETRVWQKFDKDWKCVHTHRSSGNTFGK